MAMSVGRNQSKAEVGVFALHHLARRLGLIPSGDSLEGIVKPIVSSVLSSSIGSLSLDAHFASPPSPTR